MGSEDMDVPGLLIVSAEGGVKVMDHGVDAGLAGLIICRKGIILEFPPDGSGCFSGIMISLEGDVKAFNVRYRYYPYYSYAQVPLGGGSSKLLKVFARPHMVTSGEYVK